MKIIVINLSTDVNNTVLAFTTDWLNNLSHYFQHIYVLSMYVGDLKLNENVTVYPLKKSKKDSKILLLIKLYKLIWQISRKNDIKACFAHMAPKQLCFAWPLLKFKGIPSLLWYEHGSINNILRLASFLCDSSVSGSIQGFKLYSKKHEVIGHGINTELFFPLKKSSRSTEYKNIVYVGRISPIKNIHKILDSLKIILKNKSLKFRFSIYGDVIDDNSKNYYSKLLNFVRINNLVENVFFYKGVPYYELNSIYNSADIVISLSETNSLDKVLLEAMSAGSIVITSNKAFEKIFLGNYFAKELFIKNVNSKNISNLIIKSVNLKNEQKNFIKNYFLEYVRKEHSLKQLTNKLQIKIKKLSK